MTTYSERLQNVFTDMYDFSDSSWVHFLKDHRNYLLSNSEIITLDPNVMNSFRYHTTQLLQEYNVDQRMYWIVLFLNQIKGEWGVVDLDTLIIPTESAVSNLWGKYQSYKTKISSV